MTSKKTKKKSGDIPLDNIPERRQGYSPEFKLAAVKRLEAQGGVGVEALARELGIANGSLISKWRRTHDAGLPLKQRGGARPPKEPDATGGIRAALAQAVHARDERLEVAALIVESDGTGKDVADIAKRIRALKSEAAAK